MLQTTVNIYWYVCESLQFKTCRILCRYNWYRSSQFLETVHFYSIM